MKKIDVIIISLALCTALILWLVPAHGAKIDGITAEIYVDGEYIDSYDLSKFEDGIEELLTVETDGGYNIILLSAEGAAIVESDCPSRSCVRMGRIKNFGGVIVCLPHKLIVKISGGEKNGEVDAIAG